ncbi:LutB/LldF family L-lactate oxidation iron-sulfur protein [Afifella aestuarii]|uniref:LutB/LldF family L-lactate oxidation iron-sulfur protein n=1 Tax=Afifella aestuarii TaxID=1909496 RepID=UPI000FE306A5|nr:LutB/LldF family L-lactate oxidation iron-sulfur protein [Afifella aestuarii]
MSAPFLSQAFKENAVDALANVELQRALGHVERGFIQKRQKAVDALPEFDALRHEARAIKDHTLAHLDLYLEAFEGKARQAGAEVHWAETAADAREAVLSICRRVGAKTVTKGKSMISEEIGLNAFLEKSEIKPIETDLGEYIIQLRGEPPSHIIAPAVHVNRDQVEADFRRVHTHLDPKRDLADPVSLLSEARATLRDMFLAADVGITGANFLVAETGSSIIVTNEGNGDLTQILPRVHIVLASIEKVVPTLEDVSTLLRVLARSATGQELSVYTTFSTGRKRPGDEDGPEETHVILLDNGRSEMLANEFREMLRCIRCGACMNHCPIYHAIGGHAYGATYVGPMGAVLAPGLFGLENTANLPNASTFCGRCESVCPVQIPLPKLMRHWREREYERHLKPATERNGLRIWAFIAKRPKLYRLATRIGLKALHPFGRRRGRFSSLPLAGGWTSHRDMPAPAKKSFIDQWKARS